MLKDRTDDQIKIQKLIIKELIRRPQMPIKILAGVLNIEEKDCEILVFDLEYRGSIEGRISVDFLKEQENLNIKIILDEIKKKLNERVGGLSLDQLETYLENALLRKGKLDGDIDQDVYKPGSTTYIDKLLNYTNNQIEDENKKNLGNGGNNSNNSGNKEKIIKTISK